MGFAKQEYWSGLLFPSAGELPDPGIKPTPPAAPTLTDSSYIYLWATREAHILFTLTYKFVWVYTSVCWAVLCLVAQSCPTLCDPMDCSLPGFSVDRILQARILERVAMPSFRGASQPRNWTQVSCIAGGFFISWTTRETPMWVYLCRIYAYVLYKVQEQIKLLSFSRAVSWFIKLKIKESNFHRNQDSGY